MFVTVSPGITFNELNSPRQQFDALPLPQRQRLKIEKSLFFNFFARNGIYYGLKSFGIKPGDEVLMPELNSTIEPQVVLSLGAVPVFYRIRTFSNLHDSPTSYFEDFTPDWGDVEAKITTKTKFFHLIHYLGVPNDIETSLTFCKQHKLIFFEDAAYGFLSAFPYWMHTSQHGLTHQDVIPLGSFGDFSVLCPRKTVPLPNGAICVINSREIDNALPHIKLRIPLRTRYSSCWDWLYLLRNHPKKINAHTLTHPSCILDGLVRYFGPMRRFIARHKGYVFHDLAVFDPDRIDWCMTQLAYDQLFKFDYSLIIQKNLKNFDHVRNFCVGKKWDIFPRKIRKGTVPNAILLRIPSHTDPALSADLISSTMLSHGVQFARPWHWNENINEWKNIPSVDSYVGRGLILPIHYQLNEHHLRYYLDILDKILK